jgi:phosphoserine phosphatase RsbU/P
MPGQRALIGNIPDYLRLLRAHEVFRELPEQALKDLVVRGDLIDYAAGEPMLRQGEPSDSVLLITRGEADVSVETAQGTAELGRSAVGALIGEIGVFADLPRTANVRARTAVEALRIGRDDLLQIGGDNPAFLRAVLKQLGERIAAFNDTVGYYTHALARLERQELDPRTLDDQPPPMPELVNFARAFRTLAERIGLGRRKPETEDTAS